MWACILNTAWMTGDFYPEASTGSLTQRVWWWKWGEHYHQLQGKSPCYFLKKLLNYTWPACSCTKSLQPCLTLCGPMNYSPPVSSVLGILQARILEWVAMPSSRGSSRPRDQTWVFYIFCIGRQVLYHLCYLTMLYFVLGKQHSKQMNSIIDILSITLHRVIL